MLVSYFCYNHACWKKLFWAARALKEMPIDYLKTLILVKRRVTSAIPWIVIPLRQYALKRLKTLYILDNIIANFFKIDLRDTTK